MLPPEFTIGQLIKLYEKALRTKIDKRNFRKKLFKTYLLEDLEKKGKWKNVRSPKRVTTLQLQYKSFRKNEGQYLPLPVLTTDL